MTKGETKTIQLPVYDIDGDYISCRWASDFAEGGGIYNSRIGTLNKVRTKIFQIFKKVGVKFCHNFL